MCLSICVSLSLCVCIYMYIYLIYNYANVTNQENASNIPPENYLAQLNILPQYFPFCRNAVPCLPNFPNHFSSFEANATFLTMV